MPRPRKPVLNFPGYEINPDGEAWGCRKHSRNPQGKWVKLAPSLVCGYPALYLRKDGRKHACYIHRLILETFVGPCPSGMECRHLNGIKTDNRLENLAWGTPGENMRDAIAHGVLRPRTGITNPNAKLDNDTVGEIRRMSTTGLGARKIAKQLGVGKSTVSRILLGAGWKHVPEPEGWEKPRPTAKLSKTDKEVIRRLTAAGASQRMVAERLGINQSSVSRALHGRKRATSAPEG